jgi:ADP-dependent NAD(P)H-hydrate dehydratase / NAD(P)H-hydrate epimerase
VSWEWFKETGHLPNLLPSAQEMLEHEKGFILQHLEASFHDHDNNSESDNSQHFAESEMARELMEKAGARCADIILRRRALRRIVIFCGPGNNGGDGFVIARLLRSWRREVHVILAAADHYSPLCSKQIEAYCEDGGDLYIKEVQNKLEISLVRKARQVSLHEIVKLCERADCIVDALLGTSQAGPLRRPIAELVEVINRSDRDIYAIDVPTGVDASSGQIQTPCVSARFTLCIEYVKRGLVQYPGLQHVGLLGAIPIGLGGIQVCKYELLNESVCKLLHPRSPTDHKGTRGHALVIGGSACMPGAAVLTACAALKMGAGKVTCTVMNSTMGLQLPPDILPHPLRRGLSAETVQEFDDLLDQVDSVIIGPGMGTEITTREFFRALLERLAATSLPYILDADALNLLAADPEISERLPLSSVIITPHPGEAARLLEMTVPQVQAQRYEVAERLAERTGALVVLKGPGTIIWNRVTGRGLVNTSGSSQLATSGSGDVLAGMIGAFAAREYRLEHAACLGVYLHGKAGEFLDQQQSGFAIASDIINALAQVTPNV